MWKKLKTWFSGNAFEGQGIVFKVLRFMNLMEDKAVKFSLNGMQLWATTILNIHTQIVSHDHITMGIAAASNATAIAAHTVKRAQMLNDAQKTAKLEQTDLPIQGPILPPWTGEEID